MQLPLFFELSIVGLYPLLRRELGDEHRATVGVACTRHSRTRSSRGVFIADIADPASKLRSGRQATTSPKRLRFGVGDLPARTREEGPIDFFARTRVRGRTHPLRARSGWHSWSNRLVSGIKYINMHTQTSKMGVC